MIIPSIPKNEARFAKLLAEKESVEAKRKSLFRAWQQVMDRLEGRILCYQNAADIKKADPKQYTATQMELAKAKAIQEARIIVWMHHEGVSSESQKEAAETNPEQENTNP